ncbi:MAG: 3-deoxy-7-phosphoheptulonate synthase [Gemmatimonadota bacterium]|nr:3-deoxy-7-phosphoheptulonate synthase [Gemmatimonadota bacterium]
MLIVMEKSATERQIQDVAGLIESMGLKAKPLPGSIRTAIGVMGNKGYVDADRVLRMKGVLEIIHVSKPYKQVSREWRSEDTVVEVAGVPVGGDKSFVVIAGPCAIESHEQALECAREVKRAGARLFRGGIFKPRTAPYDFQGLGEKGKDILNEVRQSVGLPVVTEILHIKNLELVAGCADMLQIGTRNMQNYDLLVEAAKTGKPILLKRGMSARLEEFLLAAEYILDAGNDQVVLCERGIRTFETATRNTLDLNSVALARQLSHLPIIVDPSHGTGRASLVRPLSLAARAVGAQGVMVEVHPDPPNALSDGQQSLTFSEFSDLMAGLPGS